MQVLVGIFMPAGDTDMGGEGPSGLRYDGIRATERQTSKPNGKMCHNSEKLSKLVSIE